MKELKKNIIKDCFKQKAFSLIEMLVVILLIGFFIFVGSQKFFNKGQKVRSTFDKFIRLNNRLVSISNLHGNTYRWVIQLDTEKKDQYWVEKKSSSKISQEENEEDEENKELEDNQMDSEFQLDESFYPEPEKLPALLDITKIETRGLSQEKGKVYIYYYPSALAQSTKIYFLRPSNQGKWVLSLDPVTKKLEVLKE